MLLFAYLVAWSPEADHGREARTSAEELGCEGTKAAPAADGLLATFDFSIGDSLRALVSARLVKHLGIDVTALAEAPLGCFALFRVSPCGATQSTGMSICRCVEALFIAVVAAAGLVSAVCLTAVGTAVMGSAIVAVVLTWGLLVAVLAYAAKSQLPSAAGMSF
jgi:hypothetical protein